MRLERGFFVQACSLSLAAPLSQVCPTGALAQALWSGFVCRRSGLGPLQPLPSPTLVSACLAPEARPLKQLCIESHLIRKASPGPSHVQTAKPPRNRHTGWHAAARLRAERLQGGISEQSEFLSINHLQEKLTYNSLKIRNVGSKVGFPGEPSGDPMKQFKDK